ncbi:hypothetical protein CYMTET_32051 [Cymbomonas tetramitiformis]|uniref:BED-type domain-containing protein n=1 Tax=Cymbomonas tetramitiformis TaxID=36881 RepID=A0AAE0FGE2_9CHLO|nr:hypothetical protein CYMTET_32051 [Cymbomonas tetramitiformis]
MGKHGASSRVSVPAVRKGRSAQPTLSPQGKGPVERTPFQSFDAAGSDGKEYFVEKTLATREDEAGFQKPPDNFRSPFWQHYKVKMDGRKFVEYKCMLCGPEVGAKTFCGDTSNLRTHLVHCHKDALVGIKAFQL